MSIRDTLSTWARYPRAAKKQAKRLNAQSKSNARKLSTEKRKPRP